MDFLIKENATLPLLKMKVIDSYELDMEEFNKNMENATVTFSMIDITCGKYIIANKAGGILVDKLKGDDISCGQSSSEPIIYYEWKDKDTKKAGVYLGEFIINFFDEDGNDNGKLRVPIREKLYIHIEESFGKTSINGF
jgi:hypothetical protein